MIGFRRIDGLLLAACKLSAVAVIADRTQGWKIASKKPRFLFFKKPKNFQKSKF